VVTKLTDKLVPLLEKITSLSDEQLEFGLKIAGFAALAGPAIWALGSLVTSVMALRDGYLLLKTATSVANLAGGAGEAGKLATNLGTAGKNAGVLGSNLNKLGAGMGIAGAAAAGVAIGTIISEAMQYMESQATRVKNELYQTSMQLPSMDQGGLESRKKSLEQSLADQSGIWNSISGTVSSLVGYTEKEDARYETFLQLEEVNALLNKKRGENINKGIAPQLPPGPLAVTQAPDMSINLTVNAPEGSTVAVDSKGVKPTVKNKRGGIMTPGLAI
jgi:hypothetical protein